MKLIFTILLFIPFQVKAVIYYVSNAGSDAADGLTTGTSWQTIAKVNSFTFAAGDQILFKKGDTWAEMIIPPSSGSIGNQIIFGTYGEGVMPLFTALETLSGFTDSSNIWHITATNSVDNLNTVLIGGVLKAKGRTPNSGYSTFTYSGNNTEINTSLNGTPNYNNAECVVRTAHWILDKQKVQTQNSNILTFYTAMTYTPSSSLGGNGYFLQNIIAALDLTGEWAYNPNTKRLSIYSVGEPANVQISTLDTLVYVNNKSYITFDGLRLLGANKAFFEIDSSNNIIVQNCSMNYGGEVGIYGQGCNKLSMLNDSIQNMLSGGIYFADFAGPKDRPVDSSLVQGNYIKNTAIIAGMGLSGNNRYTSIFFVGVENEVLENKIDSVGYNGIVVAGLNALVENNFVSNTNFIKDDGGGIYSVVGGYYTGIYRNDGTVIKDNVVINGIGATAGTTGASFAANIYLDDGTKNVTVTGNTLINGLGASLFFNNCDSLTVTGNMVIDSLGTVVLFGGYEGGSPESYGNYFTRNILYSQNSTKNVLHTQFTTTGTFDSNYYFRPTAPTTLLRNIAGNYSLAGWQAATSRDAHSTSSLPANITTALPLIAYNPTISDSILVLSNYYKDATSIDRGGSMTLSDFGSTILFTSLMQPSTIVRRVKGFKFL